MGRRATPHPTASELAILDVLWRGGPATVRAVCDELNETKTTGYTTVLKLLQIMTDKGLVRREESRRAHLYEARVARADTQKRLVGDLLDRAFGGSAMQLVQRALSTRKASPEELAEIRALIDELEEESR